MLVRQLAGRARELDGRSRRPRDASTALGNCWRATTIAGKAKRSSCALPSSGIAAKTPTELDRPTRRCRHRRHEEDWGRWAWRIVEARSQSLGLLLGTSESASVLRATCKASCPCWARRRRYQSPPSSAGAAPISSPRVATCSCQAEERVHRSLHSHERIMQRLLRE